MANKQSKRSGSGMLFGLLLGIVLGLGAAVAVALFITKAPVPFLDKASRAPEQAPLENVREAPDPNEGLRNRMAGLPSSQSSTTPSTTPPSSTPTPPSARPGGAAREAITQDIDQLIASLNQGSPPIGAVSRNRPDNSALNTASNTQTLYYLQAGAFRSANDAEALKARILMLGLNGFVQPVQVDGQTLRRVRVGPFRGIDEMNQARITLGKGNISSAVVRQ